MIEPEVTFPFFLLALSVAPTWVFFCVRAEKAVTGKQIIFGYDTHRSPALYMIPSRQNTEESPRQIQHTVWMLERAIDLTGPGVE